MTRVLIVAALRWADPRASVHPLTGQVTADPVTGGASAADRRALEYALRLTDAFNARCLAVTSGPPPAEALLREALTAGAHEALRIEGPDSDEAATAGTLRAGLDAHGERPDLVVCGARSVDRGTGATPAFLAAELGAAQALGLRELTASATGIRAVRPLGAGRQEELDVPFPAVCSLEPGPPRATVLRRGTLAAALTARTTPVPVVTVPGAPTATPHVRAGTVRPYRPRPRVRTAPTGDDPRQRLLALTGAGAPPRTAPRLVTPDDPAAAAELLLDYLRTELAAGRPDSVREPHSDAPPGTPG